MATVTVKANVDQGVKQSAEDIFGALGMDAASAIRMFFHQVVIQGGLPFKVALPSPNASTLRAIADSYQGKVESFSSVDALFDAAGKD